MLSLKQAQIDEALRVGNSVRTDHFIGKVVKIIDKELKDGLSVVLNGQAPLSSSIDVFVREHDIGCENDIIVVKEVSERLKRAGYNVELLVDDDFNSVVERVHRFTFKSS